jgi:hypothetical protein
LGIHPRFGIISEVMFDDYFLFSPAQQSLMSDVCRQNDRLSLSSSPRHVSPRLGLLVVNLFPVAFFGRSSLLALLLEALHSFGVLSSSVLFLLETKCHLADDLSLGSLVQSSHAVSSSGAAVGPLVHSLIRSGVPK